MELKRDLGIDALCENCWSIKLDPEDISLCLLNSWRDHYSPLATMNFNGLQLCHSLLQVVEVNFCDANASFARFVLNLRNLI